MKIDNQGRFACWPPRQVDHSREIRESDNCAEARMASRVEGLAEDDRIGGCELNEQVRGELMPYETSKLCSPRCGGKD